MRRSRVRGCLLGGAIGDALGNPVEFLSLEAMRRTHGEYGLTGMVPDTDGVIGRVTDDTQMTLFTAEGLIRARARSVSKGAGETTACVQHAYRRWLDTQNHPSPPARGGTDVVRTGWLRTQPWLYARRAPGNACLTGVAAGHVPPRYGKIGTGPVNPQSKGCGTVMRSAPFGLTGDTADEAFDLAALCAQITHGHPTAALASGTFAAIVTYLLEGESAQGAVLRSMELLRRRTGHEETTAALRAAVDLSGGRPRAELVESLGAGWVAEETLAIAVYCMLVRTHSVEHALLLSVNHSGDSDSTGAVCGNLLGALYGDAQLPLEWLMMTEGRAVITELADDLSLQCENRELRPGVPVHSLERYPDC
ncbi:ADP-ribosylglycohydrolase family protein [Streptomyces sp. NPDC006551]|uniref:ADP-ribosylglycohydrolase family protein n=1 Tax=Streptomyces sp. NPDC006551 TaxID=3157178 RepID=UPI0033B4B576